jgi:formylglycine-generating enzyme required for sulfatase activity
MAARASDTICSGSIATTRNPHNTQGWLMVVFLAVAGFSNPGAAQDTKYVPGAAWEQMMIAPPECLSPKDEWAPDDGERSCVAHEDWLNDITHWREERRIRIGYDGSRYEIPSLRWTQSSFIQPQLMVEDRYFYDPVTGSYTVDRYLDDLQSRYGGIDAVLIWPTYPNLGIDDRNQLDMIRSLPGGVAGVRQMVADFHRRGVRVFFPMMMWDQGTRDPEEAWPDAIAHLMAEIGADGINGDTQDGIPLTFFQAAEKAGHPLAYQPEGPPHDEAVAWNLMTWGQYKFQFAPFVDRFKWLETRHMVNISDRWARDKTDDLQFAFFNGVGWESWENIWGIWNGITSRDAEATRRVATLERGFAPLLTSAGWEPFYPTTAYGVFASKWPSDRVTLWTIVNRNEYDVEGTQLSVPALDGARYFDLYHGIELVPSMTREGNWARLSFPVEAHGFGAALQVVGEPDARLAPLMAKMKSMTAKPLAGYSKDRVILLQRMVEIQPTKPRSSSSSSPSSSEMVPIPGGDFHFVVAGMEVEGSDDAGVDVQYPWEDSPRRFHDHFLQVDAFDIDKYPVTNQEFKIFLDTTHYHPKDDLNFLKDWQEGAYRPGWENKPVTWVSLEDARSYAAWAGKRLPHEWEWQYALQGPEHDRRYPWGDAWRADAVPLPDEGRTLRGPDDVYAHAPGISAYGVMDMVGNVWQWTDEYVDEHTRSAILRGGSYYRPEGSKWYFPQAYQSGQHGKLLLMAPSMDRAGTIGFRCVTDRPKSQP